MTKKPNPVFVEIIVRGSRGSVKALKPYVDAAHSAVCELAINEGVFCGAIGRRALVSERTMTRHMRKHGFYGKE